MIVTLHELLPPKQFRDVMIQWEVDAIKLTELLALAGAGSHRGTETTSEIIEA